MVRSLRLKSPESVRAAATRTLHDLLPVLLSDNHIPYGYRIGYLSNYWSGPIYSILEARHGIRRPKFATLFCLAHIGRMSATEIGLLTGIPKNSLSRAVNELLKEGRIRRDVDASDNRRAVLSLTASGRRLFRRMLPLFEARQAKMLSVLTDGEAQALDRILTKLVQREDDWAEVY
jgi:DNA-binding MarR family transcriptional regulator